jgi:lipoyl-dependent peroxiredoxin
MAQQTILYTARTHTTGGRDGGVSRTGDGSLDIRLSAPGSANGGTNPEQLFAAGWSACFLSAIKVVARNTNVELPADLSIDAEVDLCMSGPDYFLKARLNVNLPGMEPDAADALTDAAYDICPYSNAIHGNIDVQINVASSLPLDGIEEVHNV